MIKILGDRVLVLLPPSDPEVVTDSGIILTRDPDYRKVPTRGIVAQLGVKANSCDLDDVRAKLEFYFDDVERTERVRGAVHASEIQRDIDALLSKLLPPAFDVAVGDGVIFAPGEGEEIEFEGQSFVILREADLLGVLEPT